MFVFTNKTKCVCVYTQQNVKCGLVIVHIKLQAENWISKQNRELREKISSQCFSFAEIKLHFFELLKKKKTILIINNSACQSLQLSSSLAGPSSCISIQKGWDISQLGNWEGQLNKLHHKMIRFTTSLEINLDGDQTRICLSLPPVYNSC